MGLPCCLQETVWRGINMHDGHSEAGEAVLMIVWRREPAGVVSFRAPGPRERCCMEQVSFFRDSTSPFLVVM